MSNIINTQLPESGINAATEQPTTQLSAAEQRNQEHFKKLTIEIVKGTKAQRKREAEGSIYYEENGISMQRKEFDALMELNGKWLDNADIYQTFPFGYEHGYVTPEADRVTAFIYVLTYKSEKRGHVHTSFYVFQDSGVYGKIFKAYNLEDINYVLDMLRESWRHDFRIKTAELIKDFQKETAKDQAQNTNN